MAPSLFILHTENYTVESFGWTSGRLAWVGFFLLPFTLRFFCLSPFLNKNLKKRPTVRPADTRAFLSLYPVSTKSLPSQKQFILCSRSDTPRKSSRSSLLMTAQPTTHAL